MTEAGAFSDRRADDVAELFRAATDSMLSAPNREGCISKIPSRGRLLATGDLHDNPMHFAKVVSLAALDADPDHHVILQELIHGERTMNGLDLSYRMLVKVALLLLEYPGQVHALLANHELAQMAGHSVSKGGGCMTTRFTKGLEYVFGDDADAVAEAMGVFVRALPLAARTDHGIFCSHSLPGPAMMTRFDLDIIDRELVPEDYLPLYGSAWMMVWGRGHTPEQMEAIADRWGVSLFLLGHAFVENGIEISGPRTILLNTDHERAAVLPIDLGEAPPTVETAMFSSIPLAALGQKA
ncbi:MAG: hypothetical protein O3A19_01150 [Planctomycetota bacterium]|nr:hypothetical protein [Planctomycetota bacterium]MDA1025011.1 hypothetical protein [Planctomycetota bacterium]